MRLINKIKSLIFFLFFWHSILSQNYAFEDQSFLNKKHDLKWGLKKLNEGTILYENGRKEFDDFKRTYVGLNKYYPVSRRDYRKSGFEVLKEALGPLTDASRVNAKNSNLNYMLGFIWFTIDPLKQETINAFETAYSLDPNINPDLTYWLGWTYHLNSRWDDGIKYYNLYLTFLKQREKANVFAIDDVKKKIIECGLGKSYSSKPENVHVTNLGPKINSPFPEYKPSISTDEETIFFTGRRPESIGGKRAENDNGFYEDIYTAVKSDGKWGAAKPLNKSINTEFHDATAGLSFDGSKLFIYRARGDDGGDLYESNLFGLDWGNPNKLNKNINTRYNESSVSLSTDGKHLFFVRSKETGFGGEDIYFSELDLKGEWGPAKNIGPEINTKYSEEGVYLHPDGVTLYYSGKGYNSMGGYDIFKSTFENGKWQSPVNLGYPINGPDDDAFFVVSGSANCAYFASEKPGGYGESDIYKITFLAHKLDSIANLNKDDTSTTELEIKSAKLTILKGVISDEKTNEPIESNIELIDNEKNTVVTTFKSNSNTGKYLVALPSGKNYGVAVKHEGYLFHSENFIIPETKEFQEFTLDIRLKKLDVGNSIVLKNIFFDFGKAILSPESTSELDRLITLLKENPKLKIELSSHTDNIGAPEYNFNLSVNRSKSVMAYLINKGLSEKRLVANGYGETKSITTNDSETGRQMNRRIEFKILEN